MLGAIQADVGQFQLAVWWIIDLAHAVDDGEDAEECTVGQEAHRMPDGCLIAFGQRRVPLPEGNKHQVCFAARGPQARCLDRTRICPAPYYGTRAVYTAGRASSAMRGTGRYVASALAPPLAAASGTTPTAPTPAGATVTAAWAAAA